MGRLLGGTVLVLLVGTLFAAGGAAAEEATFLEEVDAMLDRVANARANASAGDVSGAEDEARAARDHLQNAEELDVVNGTGPLAASLDVLAERAREGNATDVATQAVALEARTLALLANATVEGNLGLERTDRWIGDHLAAPGRLTPPAARPVVESDTAHDREAALDALLADRVLEEVAAAEALSLQGNPSASTHAERARLLWGHLGERIQGAVDEPAARSLDRAMANLSTGLDDVEAGRSGLAEVTGPLTAVAYHRSIDRIEAIAATLERVLFLAERTMDTEPDHAETLFEHSVQLYRNHRAHLLRHGERGTQPTDRAFQALAPAVQQGSHQEAEEAVATAARELRASTSLGHGLRFTLQDIEAESNAQNRVPLGFANTGLEGIASYRVVLTFDPAQLALADVEPVWAPANTTVEHADGRVAIEADGPPAFGRTHLATLVTDLGPGQEPVTIDVAETRFRTPAGHPELVASVENGSLVPKGTTPSDGGGGHDHEHGGHDHGGDQADTAGGEPDPREGSREAPLGPTAALAGILVAAARRRSARR